MNVNQRIEDMRGGFALYTSKVNEVIHAVNWLLGIRTANGKAISDGGRGPVIDLAQGVAAVAAAPQPWLQDPDGTTAGWVQYDVCINSITSTQWFWGTYYPNGVENPNPAQVAIARTRAKASSSSDPISQDPNGVPAGWYLYPVCIGGQVLHQWFWGSFVSGQMFRRGQGTGEKSLEKLNAPTGRTGVRRNGSRRSTGI